MFKHLLIPLDGSELAEQALAAATELARQFNSQITLLRVADAPYLLTQATNRSFAELITSLREAERQEAITYLRQCQETLQQEGFNVQYAVAEGEPVAEQILQRVKPLGADTIVMSTHGWGGLRRWVYGSVADRVLRHATVPVLLVRGRETKEDESNETIVVNIPAIETFSDMHASASTDDDHHLESS